MHWHQIYQSFLFGVWCWGSIFKCDVTHSIGCWRWSWRDAAFNVTNVLSVFIG